MGVEEGAIMNVQSFAKMLNNKCPWLGKSVKEQIFHLKKKGFFFLFFFSEMLVLLFSDHFDGMFIIKSIIDVFFIKV